MSFARLSSARRELQCVELILYQDRTFGEIDVLFENKVPARKFKYTKADRTSISSVCNPRLALTFMQSLPPVTSNQRRLILVKRESYRLSTLSRSRLRFGNRM